MKKSWKLLVGILVCAQILLPFGQVVAFGAEIGEHHHLGHVQPLGSSEIFTLLGSQSIWQIILGAFLIVIGWVMMRVARLSRKK